MTFSFGLVAALALCANNLGLAQTPLKNREDFFPNMLATKNVLKPEVQSGSGEQHIQTGTIFKPGPGTTCRVTYLIKHCSTYMLSQQFTVIH